MLFTFPSRYLSAIGLAPVFSLGWSLPPTWGCIPKQPDSTSTDPRPATFDFQALRGSHPLWRAVPSQLRARRRWIGTVCLSRPQFARSRLNADREIPDLGWFPLRSPLLRESLLVSFPPLIDMLKFSGWVSLDLRPQKKFASSRASGLPPDTTTVAADLAGLPSAGQMGEPCAVESHTNGTRQFTYEVRAGSNRPEPSPTRPQRCRSKVTASRRYGVEAQGTTQCQQKRHGPQPNVPRQKTDGAQCAFDDSMIH